MQSNEMIKAMLLASSLVKGQGGSPSGIRVGVVTNGSSFPTTRYDGSPLQNEDYVSVDPNSTFPFTIDSVTFNSSKDRAYYVSGTWYLDAGVIQDTDETPLSEPSEESFEELRSNQYQVNKDVVGQLKNNIIEYEDLNTVPTTKLYKRIYRQTADTTARIAGLYWYNFDSTETDKWEKLGGDIESGDTLPSGKYEGQLFILLTNISQASGTVKKGLYRYNGSAWNLVATSFKEVKLSTTTGTLSTDNYNTLTLREDNIIIDSDNMVYRYAQELDDMYLYLGFDKFIAIVKADKTYSINELATIFNVPKQTITINSESYDVPDLEDDYNDIADAVSQNKKVLIYCDNSYYTVNGLYDTDDYLTIVYNHTGVLTYHSDGTVELTRWEDKALYIELSSETGTLSNDNYSVLTTADTSYVLFNADKLVFQSQNATTLYYGNRYYFMQVDKTTHAYTIQSSIYDIGEYQYVHDTYSLPAIDVADLRKIFTNRANAEPQTLRWTLLGTETFFDVISSDHVLDEYSIDILAHNNYHCSYVWTDTTTGTVNPEVFEIEKVLEISNNPSDYKFPTEKAIYDYIASGNDGNARLLDNTDLDTVFNTGFYFCNMCAHRPVTANGILIVGKTANNNSYAFQMYSAFAEDKVFVRFRDNNAWKSWQKVETDIQVDRGLDITNNKIGHTNSVTQRTEALNISMHTYDKEGHITGSTDAETKDLFISVASSESYSGLARKQNEVNEELVTRIKFIESKPDVSDIVQCYDRGTDTTKTDIVHYDLTTLLVNDIVKVLIDETHDDKVSYYKLVQSGSTKLFSYIGSDKPVEVDGTSISKNSNGQLEVLPIKRAMWDEAYSKRAYNTTGTNYTTREQLIAACVNGANFFLTRFTNATENPDGVSSSQMWNIVVYRENVASCQMWAYKPASDEVYKCYRQSSGWTHWELVAEEEIVKIAMSISSDSGTLSSSELAQVKNHPFTTHLARNGYQMYKCTYYDSSTAIFTFISNATLATYTVNLSTGAWTRTEVDYATADDVNNKQDTIEVVSITATSGTLTSAQLAIINKNNLNYISYNNFELRCVAFSPTTKTYGLTVNEASAAGQSTIRQILCQVNKSTGAYAIETDYTSVEGYKEGMTGAIASDDDGFVEGKDIYTELDKKQNTITGGATTIATNDLTASRALVSNSSGKVAISDVTSTELGYLDGVTSNVQTQFNAKQATLVGSGTGQNIKTVNSNNILGSGNISVGTITGVNVNGVSVATSGAASINTSIGYYTCTTAAATVAKVGTYVSGAKYTSSYLPTGAIAVVKFTYANTASSPTLNLNSSGAKAMMQYGTTAIGTSSATTSFQAGAICLFVYDGTNWVRNQGYNTNTTYSTATTSSSGLMSSTDKTKLDGIAAGATNVTVDSALSSSSTNPLQNKAINTALSGKQATLVSGTNIKTINGNSILGSGNLSITIDTSTIKSTVLDIFFPVGTLYFSLKDSSAFNPNTAWGGTWQEVDYGYFIEATTTNPGTTLSAGLPNVKEHVQAAPITIIKKSESDNKVFKAVQSGSQRQYGQSNATDDYYTGFDFDLSKGNSIYKDGVTTVQPKALLATIWKRTA